MALKIAVLKNFLKTCPSPFIVRSDSSDVVEFDRFVEIMAAGRTALSQVEILGAMRLYKEELQKLLADGKTVKTPTGSFFMSAAGSMESLDESYLPKDQTNNHEVRLHHKPESSFEASILADLTIVREERPNLSIPNLRVVLAAGEGSGLIKAGGMVQIKGLRLRFDPATVEQGVFFVDAAGVETRSPFYPMILPGTVLASVPNSLAAGTYELVLRAAVNGKDVTEGRFESVTVSA
jgi:DNA-binding domain/Domain of unknown function (DUF4469) with IG-like fold